MTPTSFVGLWVVHCVLLLSSLRRLAAQGDPTRIPTGDEWTGLTPQSDFSVWPECANNCTGIQAAFNSSSETWCTLTSPGGCEQTGDYIRISKFCSAMDSDPCSTNQCIFTGDPDALLQWVNGVCNLTFDAQSRWNESTSQRKEAFTHLVSEDTFNKTRPSCISECQGFHDRYEASLLVEACLKNEGCVGGPKSGINTTVLCAGLTESCTDACTVGYEPHDLFVWVNRTCAQGSYDMVKWRDETVAKEAAWISQWIPALLPWNWSVQAYPTATVFSAFGIEITDPAASDAPYLSVSPVGAGTCPSSTSEKLGVFAAVNVAMVFFVLIFGRRTVVNWLTFGIFGTLGSKWWPLVGVLSACLNVLSNFINARLIHSTPGYHEVPIAGLVLLWCTRPRLSWLAVFLAAIEAEDGMYLGSAASAITSEAILQGMGAVYFGITANYGRKKGFYDPKQLQSYPRGSGARMMYAGALMWLIMLFFTLFACLTSMLGLNEVIENARRMTNGLGRAASAIRNPFQVRKAIPKGIKDIMAKMTNGLGRAASAIHNQGKKWIPKWIKDIMARIAPPQAPIANARKLTAAEIKSIEDIFGAIVIFLAFLAQWLFWAGFVKVAQERYCPPKLNILGVVWGTFSAVGIFVGSSH